MNRITWGVDGSGVRHFLCEHCELYLGTEQPEQSHHDCDTSRPPGEHRDKHLDTFGEAQHD